MNRFFIISRNEETGSFLHFILKDQTEAVAAFDRFIGQIIVYDDITRTHDTLCMIKSCRGGIL